jgi:hypothetical protein
MIRKPERVERADNLIEIGEQILDQPRPDIQPNRHSHKETSTWAISFTICRMAHGAWRMPQPLATVACDR